MLPCCRAAAFFFRCCAAVVLFLHWAVALLWPPAGVLLGCCCSVLLHCFPVCSAAGLLRCRVCCAVVLLPYEDAELLCRCGGGLLT